MTEVIAIHFFSPFLPSHLPENICNKSRGNREGGVGVNPTSDVQAAAVVSGRRQSICHVGPPHRIDCTVTAVMNSSQWCVLVR